MNINTKLVAHCVSLGFLTAAFIGPHVFADTIDSERSQVVKFDDVNMNSQAGLAVVYKRIHQTAERVCAQPGSTRKNLTASSIQDACVARAVSQAVNNVHSEALYAYYQKTPGRQNGRAHLARLDRED